MPVNDSLTLSIFILYVFNVGERILSTILVHTMHNPLAKSNPSSMGKGVVFMTSRVRWCFFFRTFLWKIKQKKAGKCSLSILCLNPSKIEETLLLSIKQKVPVWYIVFEQMINECSVVYQERIHAFMVLTLSSKHISRYLTT